MMSERYEIQGRIGRGGMSAVYRAYDTVMKRDVAIKRLLPVEETKLNEKVGNLIEREAAALARFQHPNIVTIYALEEDHEGPFVVMEMIEGKDLHAAMKEGPLSWDNFKDVAQQCLEPLVAALEVKLLHRDLKPGNVMITRTAVDRFLVKILDFGLAKFSQQPSLQTLDQKGSFLGSIEYIAPEQLELKPLDQRTDLYSLGCVLYYVLTQKAPFTGENPAQTSANHLEHRCKHIKDLRSDVPEAVADWLMRMISREVEDRPNDAAAALESWQEALNDKSYWPTIDAEKGTVSASSFGPTLENPILVSPAPVKGVRLPGREEFLPANVDRSPKRKIMTALPSESILSESKMALRKKAKADGVSVVEGIAKMPLGNAVKRPRPPESTLIGMTIPLIVGIALTAVIVALVLLYGE